MKLINVTREFATEDACLDYLERMRWPSGVCCIRCGSVNVKRLNLNLRPTGKAKSRSANRAAKRAASRRVYQCLERECLHQFTATTGTLFHKTHLALNIWFMAIAMICDAKKGISANQLKRHLGVNYRTAWFLCHRIRKAMTDPNPVPLSGDVEVDETYIGGKRRRSQGHLRNKRMILGAVERGGKLRLRFEKRAKQASQQIVHEWIAETAPDAKRLLTDCNPAYFAIGDKREAVNHIKFEWVRGDVHTNTIENAWSLLKRGLIGTFHKVSIKHLQRYLDEFSYRFNRRGQQEKLFGETLWNLLRGERLPYKTLTAEA